jgi:uncharacterized protein (TIGR02266 family)
VGSDAESFQGMRSRLLAVALPLRPWFDGRSFARTALLVADCLAQPTVARKLAELAKVGACDARCVEDLSESARAMMHVLAQIGDRPRRPPRVPGTTDGDARELRAAMIDVIERELADSDEARLWLEVVRAARDEDDLVLDLRTLAHVYRLGDKKLEEVWGARDDELRARGLADALDGELSGKTAASEWDDWLARAFALLVEVYDEACRVARFVSRGETQVDFASLVAIARTRRRQPRHRSAVPPPLPPIPPLPPPPPAIHAVPPPLPAAAPPLPPPEPRPAPSPVVAPPEQPSVAPAPSSRPSVRAHERRTVELEVDFASDSNFYVGFAENLSGGGVFVATYVLRPIGTVLDLSIQLAGDAEPLHVRGEVRWTREPSRSGDLWPGMGVRFQALAPQDEARIRAFLDARDPLFFDE